MVEQDKRPEDDREQHTCTEHGRRHAGYCSEPGLPLSQRDYALYDQCRMAEAGPTDGPNEIAFDPRHVLDEIDRFHCSALPSRVPNARNLPDSSV